MTERDILYPSEIPSKVWQESVRNLHEELNRRNIEAEVKVLFPEGTRIRPRNNKNKRFFGWRTVEDDLCAVPVVDEEQEKQKRRNNLPVWRTLQEVPIWNGKTRRRFFLDQGEYFLAYQENAEEIEEE